MNKKYQLPIFRQQAQQKRLPRRWQKQHMQIFTKLSQKFRIQISDQGYRPAIANQSAEIENYDLIFLGYPKMQYGIQACIVCITLEN